MLSLLSCPVELHFAQPVPGSSASSEGYTVRWTGTLLMGILNITPDSFSDGGRYQQLEQALGHARQMIQHGARIIDIGGESTRPGAEEVPAELELDRVLPVIRALRQADVLISIDTRKAEVAQAALQAGAHLVNDVSGLCNPEMRRVCAVAAVPAVIMHMQGTPRMMQLAPHYDNVAQEVFGFLQQQAALALAEGVPSVVLDPGFGFGKTLAHNLQLLRDLPQLVSHGHPVLVGASRKRSIDKLSPSPEPQDRDPGSIALHLYAVQQGATVIRVHNVPAHQQALRVWQALHAAEVQGG